jgi:hypothetical protein
MERRDNRSTIIAVSSNVEGQNCSQHRESEIPERRVSVSGNGGLPASQRNHAPPARPGLRVSSPLSSVWAALPASTKVAPIAKLHAAIVHSSMQVAPCQPNISISVTEKPTDTSAARSVSARLSALHRRSVRLQNHSRVE